MTRTRGSAASSREAAKKNWAEFGYLIGGHAAVYKLLAFLEAAELPEPNVVHRSEVE